MNSLSIGNLLFRIVSSSRFALFDQGEFAELTYGALDLAARNVQSATAESIEVSFPVAYRQDRSTVSSTRTYLKSALHEKYRFLAINQLSVNALVQLITITETMLGDIIRAVVTKYPQKLGAKRTIQIQTVLEATSLEEIHVKATESLLNELAYKSPTEFAEQFEHLVSINLLEFPAYHRYVEMKACRDVHIHNRGFANDVYQRKAGTLARAPIGTRVHVDIQYFLESYESCLQITDWVEGQLHEHWHSSEFDDRKSAQMQLPLQLPPTHPPTEPALDEPNSDAG